jgi:hypothetical protein
VNKEIMPICILKKMGSARQNPAIARHLVSGGIHFASYPLKKWG